MSATPFGPRPPAETPTATPVTPVEAAPAEPQLRSIVPEHQPDRQPTAADSETEGVILDPQPWTDDGEATASQPEAWWESITLTPGEGGSLAGPMLLAAGVLLGVFVMMRHLRRKAERRPVPQPADDRIAAIHERAAASIGPVERTMSEAEALARRLAATMENKAARLELLIEEADRKLEELNRAVAQASRSTPASQERAVRSGRSIDPVLLDLARVEQDRADRGQHADRADTMRIPRPAEAEPSGDPMHRRIWALADDGMPPNEIARSLNQPIGQVELILNLRKSG